MGKNLSIIYDLPYSFKKKLVFQIMRLCEKQYRKGLQHGVEMAINGEIDKKQAAKFRTKHVNMERPYSEMICPLSLRKTTKKEWQERMMTEMAMGGTNELFWLFREIEF